MLILSIRSTHGRAPDRQTVSFRVDGAFHLAILAIYIKVFAEREFPFDHN
jgi:hypothetical protein